MVQPYLKNLKKISFLKPFIKRVNLRFNEIQFLLDRSKQLNEFYNTNHDLIISDYYFDKSLIFSKMNLNEHEFKLLKNIHSHLFGVFPTT